MPIKQKGGCSVNLNIRLILNENYSSYLIISLEITIC